MSLTLITGPAVEPLTLAEAKQYCRIDGATDDALIGSLITSARERLDGHSGILGRALNTQTWRLDLPSFQDTVKLPLPPLQSVSSVKYYDSDDTLQTVASTVYEVIVNGTSGGCVRRLADQSWPTDLDTDRLEPVQITFVAGYGDSWNDVPEPIRLAVAYLVTHYYDRREILGQIAMSGPVDETADALIAPYRMVSLG